MFLSIDKENLLFLHKHPKQIVVSLLAEIEAAQVPISIIPCDGPAAFAYFTDLELLKLYRNTTGSDRPGFYRPGLEMACYCAAAAVPISDVIAWEVDLQWRSIPVGDRDGRYKYIKGSPIPQRVDELWQCNPLKATLPPEIESHAVALRLPPAATPATAAGIAPRGRDRPVAAARVAAQTPISANAGAPRGGQREIIWGCADEVWGDAGSPTSVPRVLELRKRMMDILEAKDIKRTSASSELGNWMKVRVLSTK